MLGDETWVNPLHYIGKPKNHFCQPIGLFPFYYFKVAPGLFGARCDFLVGRYGGGAKTIQCRTEERQA